MRALRILLSVFLVVLAADASAGEAGSAELDGLFARLKQAANAEEARTIEVAIWNLWTVTGEPEKDALMVRGIAAMQAGDLDAALSTFDSLVAIAPDFAEAWNKRATVHYLTGDFQASLADIEKTLTLEPRHFGALSGLGLISLAIGDEDAALTAFEKALSIHPYLRTAAHFVQEIRHEKDDNPI
jgi:tetratricopeptide (TPR) repeat protein